MELQDELTLSFYKDISVLNIEHGITLVKHIETGQFYVKKVVNNYDTSVFDTLKSRRFKGIPKIQELIHDGNQLIIIEEFINGVTLGAYLEEHDELTMQDVFRILIRLCDILSPLHSYTPSLIHRDIKPSNIMIDLNGDPFLLDFDAMKVYNTSADRDTVLLGTAGYAAPEQYGFGQSDPRTDIYSLGILAREMANIVSDKNGNEFEDQKTEEQFRRIVEKCVRIDPEDRFQSVDELRRHLTSLSKRDAHRTFSEAPDRTPRSWAPPGFRTRKPWKMVIATCVYIIMILLITVRSNQGKTLGEDILVGITLDIMIAFVIILFFDYRGIQSRLPGVQSISKLRSVIAMLLYCVLVFILAIVLYAFILWLAGLFPA